MKGQRKRLTGRVISDKIISEIQEPVKNLALYLERSPAMMLKLKRLLKDQVK